MTGAICMGMGVTSQAPHGGIFVFFAIGNLLMFVLAIIAGTVVSALAVIALKRWAHRRSVREGQAVDAPRWPWPNARAITPAAGAPSWAPAVGVSGVVLSHERWRGAHAVSVAASAAPSAARAPAAVGRHSRHGAERPVGVVAVDHVGLPPTPGTRRPRRASVR